MIDFQRGRKIVKMLRRISLTHLIIGGTILIAMVFTVIVVVLAPQQMWNWLITIVATGVAAFLAVAAGLWLNGRQESKADSKRREQLHQTLRSEMQETLLYLDGSEGMTVTLPDGTVREEVIITYLMPLGLEEAYRNGVFGPRLNHDCFRLATRMRSYNLMVSYFINSLPSFAPSVMSHALDNIEQKRQVVIRDCNLLLRGLEEMEGDHKN